MRLKDEAVVVAQVAPVGGGTITQANSGTLGLLRSSITDGSTNQTDNTAALNGTQWITNYETQTTTTTDNYVVSNCPERNQQYITGGALDNAQSGIVVADGNSNGVVVPPLAANQVEAALRAGRLLVSDQLVSRNVVLVPLGCSPDDGVLNTGEDSQLAEDDDEDSSEDSSSSAASTCSATSSSGSALSEGEGSQRRRRRPRSGILNPNYPGFQRYANRLRLATQDYDEEDEEEEEEEETGGGQTAVARNINNNNNNTANNNNNNSDGPPAAGGEALNQLDGGVVKRFDKSLSCEGALNIPPGGEPSAMEGKERNTDGRWAASLPKMADARLSGTRDEVAMAEDGKAGLCKKDKMEVNRGIRMGSTALTPSQKALAPAWAQQVALRREQHARNSMNRRSAPEAKERPRRTSPEAGFDVYNIETAMPSIDLAAIETHLRAAEERRVSVTHC